MKYLVYRCTEFEHVKLFTEMEAAEVVRRFGLQSYQSAPCQAASCPSLAELLGTVDLLPFVPTPAPYSKPAMEKVPKP